MASSSTPEKYQLEREIAQLVQDHGPVPQYFDSPIDSNVRSRLQSWAKARSKVAEKRERLEMIYVLEISLRPNGLPLNVVLFLFNSTLLFP